MIDFDPGDELSLIQDTAREFARQQLWTNQREFEAARAVSPDVREAFREIGLATLELPEALGGAGLGALARTLVLEELGAGDPGAAIALDPLGPALYPLSELGGERALAEIAQPLLERPEVRAVLVAGDRSALRVEGQKVSGEIPWVPADRVDLIVALEAEGALVIDSGFECKPVRGAGLRAAGGSTIQLDGAPVRARWEDPAGARRALARARLYVASLLSGVVRQAAEYSREYALGRVAFGRPIAHHQALAFLIADMASAVDGARLLIQEAAWRIDSGGEPAEVCATAFLEAAEAAIFVTPNALQILGGHGFMQDYPVEKLMREARVLSLMLGGVDAARNDAGNELALAEGPIELSQAEA